MSTDEQLLTLLHLSKQQEKYSKPFKNQHNVVKKTQMSICERSWAILKKFLFGVFYRIQPAKKCLKLINKQ